MAKIIVLAFAAIVLAALFLFCALTHEDPTFWLPEDKANELQKRLSAFQDKDVNLDGEE